VSARPSNTDNVKSQPAIGMDRHVYDSMTWLWILLWLVLWTVIGGLVGKGKGRTGAGIALGLFLSLIGVIIIAVMEPTPEKRAERAHEQALAMRGVFGPQPEVVAVSAPVAPVSRQEAVAEALRRDPSLGDTSDPEALKRLAESVTQVQEELELKAQVATIKAEEEAQARREELARLYAQEAARKKALWEEHVAKRQAERVAAEHVEQAARSAAEQELRDRLVAMSPLRRWIATHRDPTRVLVFVLAVGLVLAAVSVIKPWLDSQRVPAEAQQAVPGTASEAQQAAAGGSLSCVLKAGGSVACWGRNDYGQLGDGTATNRSAPVEVSGLGSGVRGISAGSNHSCALLAGGAVKCWGHNQQGQLGDGTTTDRSAPVAVLSLGSGVQAVSSGGHHSCALLAGDAVKCWGDNEYGQLGDGTTTGRSAPVGVSGLGSGVQAVSSGYDHSCALLAGGGVTCWGDNEYGQLGDGTTTSHSVPVGVLGLGSGVQAVSSGYDHSCALLVGGAVKCWGHNQYGQLGDGTTTSHSVPVGVSGLGSGVRAVSPGYSHSCALLAGGAIKCWGDNQYGQLGDGTTTSHSVPVGASGLGSGVEAVSVGNNHSCALLAGGALRCWGYNQYGELGDGTTASQPVPVGVSGIG
jgi:alpha-tubulin suppressor-like RCC1 family protein